MKVPGRTRIAALGVGFGFALIAIATSSGQAEMSGRAAPTPAVTGITVAIQAGLTKAPQNGRLFLILSLTNHPEPRFTLGRTGIDAPTTLARDVIGFAPGAAVAIDQDAFIFPTRAPSDRSPHDYWAQVLFASNEDLRSPNAPGDLFSPPRKLRLDWVHPAGARLELSRQVPPETLPADTEQIKFIKWQSPSLTRFHRRPIYLRAGIVLPWNYESEPARHYPLWVRIGGFNSRFSSVRRLMAAGSEFRKTWMAPDTPRFILLQLDGAGPYGDPYYLNSENNGPYGDALTGELIPLVEAKFRATGRPRGRVLSGTSTGGWVSLALQIFYPDAFNGAWASCPDPVDFRALELIDLYADGNAFVDGEGRERPSVRNLEGKTTLTVRDEVRMENLLGFGNSYTLSGEQWGAWNAVFSPRGANGQPVPIWDPHSGKIDHAVAEKWKQYDLRLVLENNWKTLGPKLSGKLHIASGEADEYFLNRAVHLLDQFLAKANPAFQGSVVYGPGKGHGWSNLSLREMLEEMKRATD